MPALCALVHLAVVVSCQSNTTLAPTPVPGVTTTEAPTPAPGVTTTPAPTSAPGVTTTEAPTPAPGVTTTLAPTPAPGAGTTTTEAPTPAPAGGTTTTEAPTPAPGGSTTEAPTSAPPGERAMQATTPAPGGGATTPAPAPLSGTPAPTLLPGSITCWDGTQPPHNWICGHGRQYDVAQNTTIITGPSQFQPTCCSTTPPTPAPAATTPAPGGGTTAPTPAPGSDDCTNDHGTGSYYCGGSLLQRVVRVATGEPRAKLMAIAGSLGQLRAKIARVKSARSTQLDKLQGFKQANLAHSLRGQD